MPSRVCSTRAARAAGSGIAEAHLQQISVTRPASEHIKLSAFLPRFQAASRLFKHGVFAFPRRPRQPSVGPGEDPVEGARLRRGQHGAMRLEGLARRADHRRSPEHVDGVSNSQRHARTRRIALPRASRRTFLREGRGSLSAR